MANVRYFGGGAVDLGTKNINANGTYDASSDGLDGYSQVTVNVPEKTLGTKSIVANGTYNASADNVDGYSQVTVNVTNSYNAVKIETYSTGGYDASLKITIGHVTENVFYADQSPITLLYTEVQSGSRDFADIVKIQYRNEWQIISLNNASYEYVRYNSNVTIKSWLYNVTNNMIVTE